MRLDLPAGVDIEIKLFGENAMKGIVGRKLGMTQVFDQETGRLTPVTVIEAGPCPVVAIRTTESDGYDAVQLAYEEVAERRLTMPKIGHLAKHGVGPHRRLVEIRGETELAPGETVTVEAFEPGEKVKVSGVSIGKGFQGTIKRHRFHRGPVSHGSHNVRAPGSIGASATPSRVFKGHAHGRPDGRKERDSGGPDRGRPRRGAEPAPGQGRGARPQELRRRRPRGPQVDMAAPKAPMLDANGKKAKDVKLVEAVFAADVKPHLLHETVRAEAAASRAGTRATKSRGLVGRALEAVAAEGHRPRACRDDAGRAVDGRRRRVRDPAPQLLAQGEPEDAQVGVARSANAPRPAWDAGGGRLVRLRRAFDEGRCAARRRLGRRAPLVVIAQPEEESVVKSFRNLAGVLVIEPSELEVGALVWARSVLASEAALGRVSEVMS